MKKDNKISADRGQLIRVLIATVIILVSLTNYIGAILHLPHLTRISSNWVNMAATTATCFLLAAISLLLISIKNRRLLSTVILIVFSMLILLICTASIVTYFTGIDLNIALSLGTGYSWNMPLSTAFNFLLVISVFFMLVRLPRYSGLAHTFVWLIILTTLVSFVNYFYGVNTSYVIAQYTTMSVETMLLFILLGIGIISIDIESGVVGFILKKSNTGHLLRRILPIPIILPVIIFQLEIYLQRKELIDSLSGIVISQMMALFIVGITTILIAIILENNDKKIASSQLKLQHNEMIFRQFAENIDIVFYTTTPDLSKVLYVSPAYEQIWGKSIESLYKNHHDWYDSIGNPPIFNRS